MPKRIFILAGEPSGDLHGSNLVKELFDAQPDLIIKCWGGDRMEKEGAVVLKHVNDLAFMGFIEVAANLSSILNNFKTCKLQIEDFQPDLVVFIDYPGFNLRMAKFVSNLNIPSAYYISPQIWAWKESRVKKIKRFIDHVFVILPFEKDFYAKHGIDARFVGHPLLDELNALEIDQDGFRKKFNLSDSPIIAVLPGSRTQEIRKILPLIRHVQGAFPIHQVVVSKVKWQSESLYEDAQQHGITILEGSTYELLANSDAAIVTSGTATLETALLNTPQVVVYKGNWFSITIARMLVKIKFISLVNLVLDKEAVKELIQGDANSINIIRELEKIVTGGKKRSALLDDYNQLAHKLGGKGASKIVASELLKILDSKKN
ncbi:MAG: lipid-A-disaccharide synthase [Salibacteraceae bacterium]